jgi:hypothetical protein
VLLAEQLRFPVEFVVAVLSLAFKKKTPPERSARGLDTR